MLSRTLIFSAAFLVPWSAGAQSPATPTAQAPAGSANARLQALYEREWAWRQQQGLRGNRGAEDGGPATLPKVDAATQKTRLDYWTQVLAELDSIPVAELSADEKINAAVLRQYVQTAADEVRYKTYEAPFNSDTFFWAGLNPRSGGFRTAQGYRNYISRMRDIPRFFDENTANMRAGLKRGYTVPRISVVGREETIKPYLPTDRTNAFWAPFEAFPSTIPAAEQEALKLEAEAVVRDTVAPAYAKLYAFMRDEYLKKARTTTAGEAVPDGKAFYQAQIKGFTTLDLTAEQIHQIGLSEVARIRAEMEQVKTKAGFQGDLSAFMNYLRTDPQFYAKTPYELLAKAAYVVKQMDGKLPETIGFLPRRRFTILPVPPALAPIYTGGRGGLESCLFNTYNLPARPLYTLPALAIHECNPGHSFQAALADEAKRRPAFRKATGFSGYGEGWALYWEWMGRQLGLYETPYEEFGSLTYEMWRAARLAIDTGIHHYGWTREQAQKFLRDNAALSEHEITTEIDRYIAWPGQALAYKLGEILIRKKRKEAEAKLGTAFDQRHFHDAILALGSVPLPVLEARLDQFIADGGKLPEGWNPAMPE